MSFRGRGIATLILAGTLGTGAAQAGQTGWSKTDAKQGWSDSPTTAAKKATPAAAAKPAAKKKAPAPGAKEAPAPVKPAAAPQMSAPAPAATPAATPAAAPTAPAGPSTEGILMPKAPQQTAAPIAAKPAAAVAKRVPATKRWLDIQAATAAVRYRDVETSAHVRTSNQMQTKEVAKGRVKLDRGGAYSVNVGLSTGNSLTGSWNTTGVGTGSLITNLYLKQLYFSAAPIKGVELQYGGISVARGESTEITSYDDDVYLVGKRASVKRPKQWFFDEVTLTQAYLGDASTPSFLKRYKRIDQANYHQVLFGKKAGAHVAFSGDYTRVTGVGTVRTAMTYKQRLHVVDLVRYEQYHRIGKTAASGFSIYGEKAFGKIATFGTGWTSIDKAYGGLNGDRFNKGRRLFASGSLTLSPEFTVSGFYTRAMANSYAIANATRFDLIFTYNLLKTLQRTGQF